MFFKGEVKYNIVVSRFFKFLVFSFAGWFPAAAGFLLLAFNILGSNIAWALLFSGALVVIILALSQSIRIYRQPVCFDNIGSSSQNKKEVKWEDVANPKAIYANRWTAYKDLCQWLNKQDFSDKTVVEFGDSNEILYNFMTGAKHTVLSYPEHDVQNLDNVADNQFDVALLDQTLEHVMEPSRALSEVYRILKPQGFVIITTPFFVPVRKGQNFGDYYRWTPQGMQVILERAGFDAQVRLWGNLKAVKMLLGNMYMMADEAEKRGLDLSMESTDELFPVNIWAIAKVKK